MDFNKKNKHTKNLVTFGSYLLSDYRDKNVSELGKNEVNNADLENWHHWIKKGFGKENKTNFDKFIKNTNMDMVKKGGNFDVSKEYYADANEEKQEMATSVSGGQLMLSKEDTMALKDMVTAQDANGVIAFLNTILNPTA